MESLKIQPGSRKLIGISVRMQPTKGAD